jgi:hypothetical protein
MGAFSSVMRITDRDADESTLRDSHQSSNTEERIVKTLFAMATTGTLLLNGIASAQELPVYGLSGFPISPCQISIMGATANLKEQSPSTSLTMGGMPASPLQILVLTPRHSA